MNPSTLIPTNFTHKIDFEHKQVNISIGSIDFKQFSRENRLFFGVKIGYSPSTIKTMNWTWLEHIVSYEFFE